MTVSSDTSVAIAKVVELRLPQGQPGVSYRFPALRSPQGKEVVLLDAMPLGEALIPWVGKVCLFYGWCSPVRGTLAECYILSSAECVEFVRRRGFPRVDKVGSSCAFVRYVELATGQRSGWHIEFKFQTIELNNVMPSLPEGIRTREIRGQQLLSRQ